MIKDNIITIDIFIENINLSIVILFYSYFIVHKSNFMLKITIKNTPIQMYKGKIYSLKYFLFFQFVLIY